MVFHECTEESVRRMMLNAQMTTLDAAINP